MSHPQPSILIVDDDLNTREGLARALRRQYKVFIAESARTAIEIMANTPIDVLLSDVRMPGMDGLGLLQRAIARDPAPVCIMLTAYGNVETAVEAMKRGARDFLTKPVDLDHLDLVIQRGLKSRKLETENVRLHKQLDKRYGLESIIGASPSMQELYDTIQQVAPSEATVLIQGESGTGKELVAQAIHRLSNRAQNPFIAIHCAALPTNLLESELFGHERGAFTGATERRSGRFELADGGSLFLDEIGEIEASTQVKLLRVLEDRRFERLGGNETIDVDIRLIAATNRDLKSMTEEGEFRDDLFYRLDVINIELPPLRDRIDDLPMLCKHFLEEFNEKNKKSIQDLSTEALNQLAAYNWPGNVRELRNTIEKMVVLARGDRITPRDIPPSIRLQTDGNGSGVSIPAGSDTSIGSAERLMIERTLQQCEGNKTKAAERLGISRRTLHRKLNRYQGEDDA